MEPNFCPSWLLARLGIPPSARVHAAILFSTLALVAAVPIAIATPHLCLFQTLLGIPCPGCGVLHGLANLATLRFAAAWKSNPAAMAVGALFMLQLIARPLVLIAPGLGPPVSNFSKYCSNAVVAILLVVWALRIITGGIHGGYFLPQM